MPKWFFQSTEISKNIDLSVFKIVRSSLSLLTSRNRLEGNFIINEKQWFSYTPSACMSRRELIYPYLNRQVPLKTQIQELQIAAAAAELSVMSSCTGTQRNETLTNCVTTPCMDMKTIGIPPCTGTPGQPQIPRLSFVSSTRAHLLFEGSI